MKVALSPIEFARRARRLYSKNEAVVDGDLRLNYEEFLTAVTGGRSHFKIWASKKEIRSHI